MRAVSIALLTITLLILAPAAARGDDPPPPVALRLSYVLGPGAQNCPPEQALHDEVARRMGYDPFTPDAPELIIATLNRSGRLFSGTLELFDSSGKSQWKRSYAFRGQKDEDCAALDMAMAIDIRVAFIQSLLPSTPATPSPSPSPETPAAPPDPPKVEPPPPSAQIPPPAPPPKVEPLPPASPRSDPLRLNLGIASALALRTASRPFAFNLAATAGLRYRSFSGALEFRWTSPEMAAVDPVGREIVRVMQYAGEVLPCGHYRALVYCGVGQVTAVAVKGAPDTMPLSTADVSAATGARLGADLFPVWQRRFALRLSADLLVTFRDVAINVVDAPPMDATSYAPAAWTTPRLTVGLSAGFVTDLRLR